MNYLITGASGFIGSQLLVRLGKDANIRILSRDKKICNNINIFYCDLKLNIIPEVAFENIDVMYHIAGLAHDTLNNIYKKDDYFKVNLYATIKLAKIAKKKCIKKFIYISSIKAAGDISSETGITETDVGKKNSFYEQSKYKAEEYLLNFQNYTDMIISIIRPALVYGNNVKGNILKMITYIDKNLFLPPPNIKNKISMIHIENLIDLLFLIEKESFNKKGHIFNAVDSNLYSTREIYDFIYFSLKGKKNYIFIPIFGYKILSIIGSIINVFIKFPYTIDTYNKLVKKQIFISKKASNLLGFSPKNDFRTSIKDIINSYKKNKNSL